jgi:hypothetical protein
MKHFHGLHEIIALDFCMLRHYISNNRLGEVGATLKEVTVTPHLARVIGAGPIS